jgi:hypothetical protein
MSPHPDPIDAELAQMLDVGEIVEVIRLAARQIAELQQRVAAGQEREADLSARVAMLEAILPATLPPF